MNKEIDFLQRLARHTVVLTPRKKKQGNLRKSDWIAVQAFIYLLTQKKKVNWSLLAANYRYHGWSDERTFAAYKVAEKLGYVTRAFDAEIGDTSYTHTGRKIDEQ